MAEDPDVFEDVPSNVRTLIEAIGFVDDMLEGDMLEVYRPLTEGKCMTCGSKLGETTILFVTHQGIVAGYCGGPCVQDMAILGWLQEQHEDITDGIKFRGGAGDTVE
jgi:hypothetical protein